MCVLSREHCIQHCTSDIDHSHKTSDGCQMHAYNRCLLLLCDSHELRRRKGGVLGQGSVREMGQGSVRKKALVLEQAWE